TPLITQRLADILHAAGVPEDIFIHLPGQGSQVGKLLVEDPHIAGVIFTGSKEVGMWIAHTAGKKVVGNELFGYEAPAKVITEMGGKNAIIVSPNAELDETVAGILYSAFGNAGQKCSACSRVIVHEAVKDRLIERLKEACRNIQVGPAFEHATFINPLIARKEKERLQREVKEVIREAKLYHGKIHLDRSNEDLPGWCMGPVLVELPIHRALQGKSCAKKELFGPVLHVTGCKTREEAIQLFNATEYGLTGGIFSQSQDDVEYLSRHLEAGNLYVNRPITGARVSIEPFGGFKLSGTGPKVGGPFYLEAFHHPLEPKEARDQKVIEIDAASIQQYKELMDKAAGFFRNKFYWNRKIPGQLSFNDLNQIRKKGLYLALEDQPDLKTFLYLLAAWGLGCEIKVLCKKEETYAYWKTIEKNLKPIPVELADAPRIVKALQDRDLSFLILEGNADEVQHFLAQIYDGTDEKRLMRRVLTKLDAPDIHDFERYLEPFVHVRSFAVNVMRHGAPLEVDGERTTDHGLRTTDKG
ncbi:MAG: aldehyde dehydrogenase family protein, partial [Deltaproteobacteria bacterium]|nr:aldehyde dehydrogenase family protein [Deltaproteobacteria bacterium]